MPVPRRRHGPSRQGKDRAHKHLHPLKSVKCSHCEKMHLPHRVCPECGTYDGRSYVVVVRGTGD